MTSPPQRNVYTNPAFCQQSEFYNSPQQQRCKSPPQSIAGGRSVHQRQPPVGAMNPVSRSETYLENPSTPGPKPTQYVFEETYKEMLVDDTSFCKSKQQTNVNNGNRYAPLSTIDNDRGMNIQRIAAVSTDERRIRYVQNDYNANNGNEEVVYRSEEVDSDRRSVQKHRYEYIPMQEHQDMSPRKTKSPPNRSVQQQYDQEEVEVAPGVVHRYAVIPQEQETQFVTTNKGRYALVPVEDMPLTQKRYPVVTQQEIQQQQQQQQQQYQQTNHRYEYIPEINQRPAAGPAGTPTQPNIVRTQQQTSPNRHLTSLSTLTTQSQKSSPPSTPRKGNPIATQKLHELLSTPRKVQRSRSAPRTPQKITSPISPRRSVTPISFHHSQQQYGLQQQQQQHEPDLFCTPNKVTHMSRRLSPRNSTPKAQQKLNYAISTRQQQEYVDNNKRHTAVIAPICSSPVQSVYSETTFSNKTESWMNLSKPPVQASLAVAALMMVLCGAVSSGLCFYMISVMGRLYFLDFGLVSGFACFFLGCLGFRSRNCHWLPNRNYISGYVVLSIFSLLTCAALLTLLFMQPKPGSPWADVISGAVCGISGLSLLLAASGVIASYCCKYPPPDNRVQHCARGFTV